MNTVRLASVKVPDYRMRRVFDSEKLQDLIADILTNGLLHLPVVRADGENYTLAAGERRFRAITAIAAEGKSFRHGLETIPPGYIPVTYVGELSELEASAIEYAENAIRVDLSWQEQAEAVGKLKALREAQAAAGAGVYKTKDLVNEVLSGGTTGTNDPQAVRDMAIVAKHLHDKDVAGAKTLREAKKIIEKKQRALIAEELGLRLTNSSSMHTLHVGDSLDWVKALPNATFDLIVTDPPYGIDMHKNSAQSGSEAGTVHAYDDTFEFAEKCVRMVAEEGFRVCKANAHAYMFCDIELWPKWHDIFTAAGWYVWPKPIIWSKTNAGSLLGSANGPRHVYEAILFAQKGAKVCQVQNDVVTTVAGDAELHPANKPVDLLANLLSRSAVPGDVIVDFFCGSGGIFEAAHAAHCIAYGCERDPQYAAVARLRLESL